MNLILLDGSELDGDGRAVLRGPRARHVTGVIGVTPGAVLRVGLVRGPRGSARVEGVHDGEVTLRCTLDAEPPPPPWLDVVLAVPRPKVLARVLETLAAFGVRRLDLVNAWRVDRSYFGSGRLEDEAVRASLVAGCEQGQTTWLPEHAIHPLLVPYLRDVLAPRLLAEPARRRLLAHPDAPGIEQTPGAATTVVAVGPEGGWIAEELASFARLGFHTVAIAPAVLRVETAVAALLGQVSLWRRLSSG